MGGAEYVVWGGQGRIFSMEGAEYVEWRGGRICSMEGAGQNM